MSLVNFDFRTDNIELQTQINKLHFKGCKVFNDNRIGYQFSQTNVILNKTNLSRCYNLRFNKIINVSFTVT